ncbi:MAG TPA: aldehyde dehydrogenase family protein [Candidatus Sulfomarinibacteraceae bacterium]|nr:aldehyde dehydrogenase family protein [Candidatus Sulfomarinibacteraceae bacterium]
MSSTTTDMPIERDFFVDGEWTPARSGLTIERHNPANGELIGVFARAAEEDVTHAISVARRAFDEGPWPRMLPVERAEVLRKAADIMEAERDEMGLWESLSSGAPINQAKAMIDWAIDLFRYYAGLARDVHGESFNFGNEMGLVLREPVGVVSQILPWNFPINQASWKVAPALAAGCTIVAKPDSKTPITTLEMARILSEAGLPDGVFNVIVGEPQEIGDVLVAHPGIDMVSLTGSTETGKIIMRKAADTLKHVHLELGGKSPNVVFPDADLDAAAKASAWGVFFRCGQICTASSRLLVHESIKDQFLELLHKHAQRMQIGDPMSGNTHIGPLVSQEQLQRVQQYIERGQEEGAQLVQGGQRLSGESFDKGYYLPPTVFSDVTTDMTIAQEEIFGPVTAVMTFRNTREALQMANDTIYGLTAGVWSSNLSTALQMARGIRAGKIWVNTYGMVHVEMPHGGYKQSGVGRELGRAGLEEYLQTKTVHIALEDPFAD